MKKTRLDVHPYFGPRGAEMSMHVAHAIGFHVPELPAPDFAAMQKYLDHNKRFWYNLIRYFGMSQMFMYENERRSTLGLNYEQETNLCV